MMFSYLSTLTTCIPLYLVYFLYILYHIFRPPQHVRKNNINTILTPQDDGGDQDDSNGPIGLKIGLLLKK